MTGKIYIEDPSFDYAHFIPGHEKCSRLHGHTSQLRLSLTGNADQVGMILDFAVIKMIATEVLESLDHRLLVPEAITAPAVGGYEITVQGDVNTLFLRLPSDNVFLLRNNSTIEHITETIAELIWDRLASLPQPLLRLEVECSEGQHKGACHVRETSSC